MSEGDHEQTDTFSEHGDDHEHHAMAHEEDHEGGHDEPWLVSYADLMTLLFGFFVIMYSFASAKNSDEESDIFRIKKEIATYFGGEYINPMESVAKAIQKELNSTATGREVSFLFVGESLELIIQSKVLFSSGSAEIIPSQLPVIDNLLGVIVDRQIKGYQVIIEGHTDDVPISTEKFRSNWDLSAARASTVAMLLENKNYDGSHISIYAFGDNRPLVPNRDSSGNPIELNMAKNRRIVIRLLSDKKDTPPAVQKKETEKKTIQEQDKNLEKGN